MGHSFLHNGPCLTGLSPVIIHVLFGGSPDTTTIQIEDCPDIDIRNTIQLVRIYLAAPYDVVSLAKAVHPTCLRGMSLYLL